MIQGKGNLQTPVDYCSTLVGNTITIEIFFFFFFATTDGPLHTTVCMRSQWRSEEVINSNLVYSAHILLS
ncbi:hypothetical protein BDV39DRAFT_182391 [Aspergillus sergii]|uniref:Uncharacterized protein n=1 Tax=Aspergillus sergii TaxID=1034303 RepID=A0A5N6WRW0_9EURO|nr:hypothetical protein BDV39DRAFT_182391 [Aspergillus sergii]